MVSEDLPVERDWWLVLNRREACTHAQYEPSPDNIDKFRFE